MTKLIIFTLSALWLFSCAPRYTWQHPNNYNEYYFNIDTSECDMYAQQEKFRVADQVRGNSMAGIIMITTYDRAFENCMYTKGWYKSKG